MRARSSRLNRRLAGCATSAAVAANTRIDTQDSRCEVMRHSVTLTQPETARVCDRVQPEALWQRRMGVLDQPRSWHRPPAVVARTPGSRAQLAYTSVIAST